MRELLDILRAYRRLKTEGRTGVLATVVKLQGSAYRRPGARMLLLDSGQSIGLVSGGCLEGDLHEKAQSVLQSGSPRLITYDSTGDDDLLWGYALGCAGRVHVLLERVPPQAGAGYMDFLGTTAERGEPCVVITCLSWTGPPPLGTGVHFAMSPDSFYCEAGTAKDLYASLMEDATSALRSGHSITVVRSAETGTGEFFVEAIPPPLPLRIFGAGADASPVCRLAHALGWNVTVIDGRAAYLREENFPLADRLLLAHPETIGDHIVLSPGDAAIVMTHNFNHDIQILKVLFHSPVWYIGLLASRGKTDLLLRQLERDGVALNPDDVKRLHTPIGLDLGAETPEEIALAIIAEIQAERAGRMAGFLKNRQGAIHAGDSTFTAAR